MKLSIKALIYVTALGGLSVVSSGFAAPLNAISSVALIEHSIQFQQTTIKSNIPYEAIFTSLQDSCEASSVESATQRFESFIQDPANNSYRYDTTTQGQQKKFLTIRNMIGKIDTIESDSNCTQKYFLYKILQKIHSTSEYYTSENSINFNFMHGDIDTTHGNEKAFAYMAEHYMNQRIRAMSTEGLLKEQDLINLTDKIYINYNNNCGLMHGSYHMTQNEGGADRNLTKIEVNINICYDNNYVEKFNKYVDQLFTHEVAHYLYYFIDTNTTQFDQICRIGNKNICDTTDFVSNYSQQSKEEDYAESFTYRYLLIHQKFDPHSTDRRDHIYIRPIRLARKLEHFEDLLEKE